MKVYYQSRKHVVAQRSLFLENSFCSAKHRFIMAVFESLNTVISLTSVPHTAYALSGHKETGEMKTD